MIIRFSAPSKTFLSGEYAVLLGAPALVLNTGPRFEFTAARGGEGSSGLPPGSPSGRWLEMNAPFFKEWGLKFHDPHAGRGGFGASSAQFLFVHTLSTLLQISVSRAIGGLDLEELRRDFRVACDGKASGADLMGQAIGGTACVQEEEWRALAWPYPDLAWSILRTGNKVETHTHLKNLNPESFRALLAPAREVHASFASAPEDEFLRNLRKLALLLRQLNLQTPATLTQLALLEKQPWCKLAKGCGALGADTLLVFYAKKDSAAALKFFTNEHLAVVAGQLDLSTGLEMNWNWSEGEN